MLGSPGDGVGEVGTLLGVLALLPPCRHQARGGVDGEHYGGNGYWTNFEVPGNEEREDLQDQDDNSGSVAQVEKNPQLQRVVIEDSHMAAETEDTMQSHLSDLKLEELSGRARARRWTTWI